MSTSAHIFAVLPDAIDNYFLIRGKIRLDTLNLPVLTHALSQTSYIRRSISDFTISHKPVALYIIQFHPSK